MAKVILGAGLGGVACAYELAMILPVFKGVDAVAAVPELCNPRVEMTPVPTGAAFAALPQTPPRNVTRAKEGKWVHLAKVAFERYLLRKVKTGSVAPLDEKYLLSTLGIEALKK